MKLHNLLRSPLKVFILCLIFAFTSLLLNGGWIHLYQMHRDQAELASQIMNLQSSVEKLNHQMKMAQDPTFIERQAMDQLDMASDNDLVFVFSE